jgi:uncharacterized protein (DUF305 family)
MEKGEVRWSQARATAALGLALAAVLFAKGAAHSAPDDFNALMRVAMQHMHARMEIPSSGDPDRDFAALMIPHHQGAIDMAKAEIRYGRNEQLRRLAQEIIVDQQQEIAAMRLALGDPLPAAEPAPTQRR